MSNSSGIDQLVDCGPHKAKVVGSNPALAINSKRKFYKIKGNNKFMLIMYSQRSNLPTTYNVYEVYYRLRGEKVSRIANTRIEANRLRDKILSEKRKFLGLRKLTLQEVN